MEELTNMREKLIASQQFFERNGLVLDPENSDIVYIRQTKRISQPEEEPKLSSTGFINLVSLVWIIAIMGIIIATVLLII